MMTGVNLLKKGKTMSIFLSRLGTFRISIEKGGKEGYNKEENRRVWYEEKWLYCN